MILASIDWLWERMRGGKRYKTKLFLIDFLVNFHSIFSNNETKCNKFWLMKALRIFPINFINWYQGN